MEANTSVVSTSVASERGSGDGRSTKVKSLKNDDARKTTAGNKSEEDLVGTPAVGILSENKSSKGAKSVNSRKSSLSKAKGEGDVSNAGVNAGLEKRKQSLVKETHSKEKSSIEKNHNPGTVHGVTKKEKGGDAVVPDRAPEKSKPGLHSDDTAEKPHINRTVEQWKKHVFKTGPKMNLYKVVQTVPSEYLTRARGSEVIQPTVNGLRQFGISKGEISRVIVKFSSPPTPHPLTLCFHFPSTFLTHRYVLDMIRAIIQGVEGAKVTSIQFIDRNTIHGARGLDNRWLVTVNQTAAKDVILAQGLQLFNRRILVRPYDDILREEYDEFIEYAQIRRKLYNEKEEAAVIEEEQEDDEALVEECQSEETDQLDS